jgi:hypothetical protein
MPSATKFNQFPEDCLKGVHNFTSDATCTVTVALMAAANAPVAGNSVLADLTQISYANLSARVVSGVTAEQSGGVATITANDLTLTASGGAVATFRYFALYNDDPTSPADPLIQFYDYGSNVTLLDGESVVLDFGASGIGTLT